jgi:hypothetical protein
MTRTPANTNTVFLCAVFASRRNTESVYLLRILPSAQHHSCVRPLGPHARSPVWRRRQPVQLDAVPDNPRPLTTWNFPASFDPASNGRRLRAYRSRGVRTSVESIPSGGWGYGSETTKGCLSYYSELTGIDAIETGYCTSLDSFIPASGRS